VRLSWRERLGNLIEVHEELKTVTYEDGFGEMREAPMVDKRFYRFTGLGTLLRSSRPVRRTLEEPVGETLWTVPHREDSSTVRFDDLAFGANEPLVPGSYVGVQMVDRSGKELGRTPFSHPRVIGPDDVDYRMWVYPSFTLS
jgi:hypothetical protein